MTVPCAITEVMRMDDLVGTVAFEFGEAFGLHDEVGRARHRKQECLHELHLIFKTASDFGDAALGRA